MLFSGAWQMHFSKISGMGVVRDPIGIVRRYMVLGPRLYVLNVLGANRGNQGDGTFDVRAGHHELAHPPVPSTPSITPTYPPLWARWLPASSQPFRFGQWFTSCSITLLIENFQRLGSTRYEWLPSCRPEASIIHWNWRWEIFHQSHFGPDFIALSQCDEHKFGTRVLSALTNASWQIIRKTQHESRGCYWQVLSARK